MANQKLFEDSPTETGIVKIVWRLDSIGSGGMNSNAIPLYVTNRKLVILGVSGTATITVKLYADLRDVPAAPNDFPPAGIALLGTLGPYSLSPNTAIVENFPLYADFAEPTVSNIGGTFVAYAIIEGAL
jgi:hypothetical protein